jgi:hypothetical protein
MASLSVYNIQHLEIQVSQGTVLTFESDQEVEQIGRREAVEGNQHPGLNQFYPQGGLAEEREQPLELKAAQPDLGASLQESLPNNAVLHRQIYRRSLIELYSNTQQVDIFQGGSLEAAVIQIGTLSGGIKIQPR